jgi:hypothetical protein
MTAPRHEARRHEEARMTEPVLPCGHTTRIGQQYQGTPEDYDGVSEWICGTCGRRWGRWSKRELHGNEIEGRYGREARG